MKLYFLFILAICFTGASTHFYDIQVIQLNGAKTSMADYTCKKILVAPVSSSKPDITWLKFLENLARFNDSIAVFVAPATDDDTANLKMLQVFKHQIPDLILLKPAYLKKDAGNKQMELFDWLTNKNQNGHFDIDVQPGRQIFLINKKGTLYAVLSGEITAQDIKTAIREHIR